MNFKNVFLSVFLSGLVSLCFLLGCSGKNSPSSPSNPSPPSSTPIASNSTSITASTGGSVTLTDGTNVSIPANVLSQNSSVTISKYIYSAAPQNIQPLATPQYAYKFDSGSATFTGAVTISIPYTSSNIPAGASENNLVSEYYDGAEWVVADSTVDTANKQVITPTNHFSWWVLSVDAWLGNITAASSVAPLTVPYYFQGQSQWCADTTGSMLLRFYGNNSENCDVAAYLNQPENTPAYQSQLSGYLNNQTFNTDLVYWLFTTQGALQNYIAASLTKGQPIILGSHLPTGGHDVVVTGYDGHSLSSPGTIYINDPSGSFIQTVNPSATLNQFNQYAISWNDFFNALGNIFAPGKLVETLAVTNKSAGSSKTGSIQLVETEFRVKNTNNLSDALTFVWDGSLYHPYGYGFTASTPSSRSASSTFGYCFTNQDQITIQPAVNNLTSSAKSFSVTFHFQNTDDSTQYQGGTTATGSIPAYASNNFYLMSPVTLAGFTAGNYNMIVDLYDGATLTDTTTKKFYLHGSSITITPTSTSTPTPTPTQLSSTPTDTPTPNQTSGICYSVTTYGVWTCTPTDTPTNTPGPLFSPVTWTFDDAGSTPTPAVTGWSSNNNGGSIAVPAPGLSSLFNQESGCSSGCNSLWLQVPFTAANQTANLEYAFGSDPNSGVVNLTGMTISLYYYLDGAPADQSFGQLYIQGGAADTYWLQSHAFSGGTGTLVTGAWTQETIPASIISPYNPAYIWKFGVQIGTSNTASSNFQNVNLYIDNVVIQ